jgi:hypothetical protein
MKRTNRFIVPAFNQRGTGMPLFIESETVLRDLAKRLGVKPEPCVVTGEVDLCAIKIAMADQHDIWPASMMDEHFD